MNFGAPEPSKMTLRDGIAIKNSGEIVEPTQSVESVEQTLARTPESHLDVANDECEHPTKSPLFELSDVFAGCFGFLVLVATSIACSIFIVKYLPALEKDALWISVFIALGIFKGTAHLFAHLRNYKP